MPNLLDMLLDTVVCNPSNTRSYQKMNRFLNRNKLHVKKVAIRYYFLIFADLFLNLMLNRFLIIFFFFYQIKYWLFRPYAFLKNTILA